MIHALPILNPEVYTTKAMGLWLRGKKTIRRMLHAELFFEDPFCSYCRKPLINPWSGVLDHATPRSGGGSDRPSNAILSCISCDRAKGQRTISEWKAALLAGLFSINSRPCGPVDFIVDPDLVVEAEPTGSASDST